MDAEGVLAVPSIDPLIELLQEVLIVLVSSSDKLLMRERPTAVELTRSKGQDTCCTSSNDFWP